MTKRFVLKLKKLMTDKDYLSRYLDTQTQHKYLSVKLTRLETMENLIVDENTLSTTYADSEDTELYELEERTIGTLTFINTTEEAPPLNVKIIKTTTDITKKKSSQVPRNKNLNFKCSIAKCKTYAKTRKEIDQHYKTVHVSMNYCRLCTKKYSTPYGLKQHLYMHHATARAAGHICGRCNKVFPFLSHLKIHHLSHARKQKYECDDCFMSYKFKHDMQRHKREHNARIIQCDNCDYTGSKLLLNEHAKQHNPDYHICCHNCNIF